MAATNPRRFFFPANAIRIVELLCAVLALAMVAGWNSKGITYRDLNSHDFNFVSNITFFVASSVICIIILSATVVFILFRKPFIPPKIDLPVSGLLCALLLLSSVVLGVSLAQLGNSISVKEAELSFRTMEGALALGLICSICLICSTVFAFRARLVEGEIPSEQTRSIAELPGDIPT
ncbi:uncharacterized protein LOC112573944 [Pomacea canaliculata]|uniref:uncharacterized protein LOC112573944 n=1 Tax=Pomacea canaliculata TaxID=400727 RepID=UPI000D7253E4|nr:uncharacterized protein LOC112573944 [Pomacea canaliculata]